MKKIGVKFVSLALSLIMTASMAMIPAQAETTFDSNLPQTETRSDTSTAGDNAQFGEISPKAVPTNSFGSLIANKLNTSLSTVQSAENGQQYVITDVSVEGTIASVTYVAPEVCTIVVAAYNENSGELVASGTAQANMTESVSVLQVEFEQEQLPEYFVLKAFMLNDGYEPLSDAYVSAYYTSGIQEVLSISVDDFDSDRVINLDNNKETNFAVYADGIIQMPFTENCNIPDIIYSSEGVYHFSNANDDFKNLSVGDSISYVYNNEIMLIHVDDISVDGDTVTIIDFSEPGAEDFFDYIKIDTTADTQDTEYDPIGADSSVTFLGVEPDENDFTSTNNGLYPSADAESIGMKRDCSLKFKVINGKISDIIGLEPNSDADKGKSDDLINFACNVDVGLKIHFDAEFYYNAKTKDNNPTLKELIDGELKLNLDIKMSVNGSVTASSDVSIPIGRLKFAPIPGVTLNLTPALKLSVSATVSFTLTLEKHFGCNWSLKAGICDTSKPVYCKFGVKIDGKIYVGIDLGPKIGLVSEKLINVDTKMSAGGQVTSAMETSVEINEEKEHLCKACSQGSVKGVITFSVGIGVFEGGKLVKGKRFTVGNTHEIEFLLFDYYYSLDHDESDFTKCPYYRYKTNISVKEGENSAKNKKVHVRCVGKNDIDNGREIDLETNEKGTVSVLLAPGTYNIIVDNYSKTYTKKEGLSDYTFEFSPVTIFVSENANDAAADRAVFIKNRSAKSSSFYKAGRTDEKGKLLIFLPEGEYALKVDNLIQKFSVHSSANILTVFLDTLEDEMKDDYKNDFIKALVKSDYDFNKNLGAIKGAELRFVDLNFDGYLELLELKTNTVANYTSIYYYDMEEESVVYLPAVCSGLTEINGYYNPEKAQFMLLGQYDNSDNANGIHSHSNSQFTFNGKKLDEQVYAVKLIDSKENVSFFDGFHNEISEQDYNLQISDKTKDFFDIKMASDSIKVDSYCKLSDSNKQKKLETLYDSFSFNLEPDDNPDKDTNTDESFPYSQDKTPIIDRGECGAEGNNVKWELHESGTLYIYGERAMKNYSPFDNCWGDNKDSIKKVFITDGIDRIGEYAFYNCHSLKSVDIADSVLSIGSNAFDSCILLSEIIIPDRVFYIGDYAFKSCVSLTSVKIPGSIRVINDGMFSTCWNLKRVEICSGIVTIGQSAFLSCSSLTSIEIPQTVSYIKSAAFAQCNDLADIYYLGDKTKWKSISIDDNLNEVLTSSAAIHYNSKMPESSGSSLPNLSTATITNYLAPIPKNTKTMVVSKYTNKQYTGLTENGRYIFMLVKSDKTENLIESDNLIYIDQFTADENGVVIAEYPDTYGNEYMVLIFGEKTTADTTIENTDSDTNRLKNYHKGDTVNVDFVIGNLPNAGAFDADISYNNKCLKLRNYQINIDIDDDFKNINIETNPIKAAFLLDDSSVNFDQTSVSVFTLTFEVTKNCTLDEMGLSRKTTSLSQITDNEIKTLIGDDSDTEDIWTNIKVTVNCNHDADKESTPTLKGIMGDLDDDGKITSADSLLILRQSVSLEHFTDFQQKLADVDGDGKITSADALEVLRYSVSLPTTRNIGKTITK